MAAFCGRLDCLQLLVKHRATIDSVDYDGNTPGAYRTHFVGVYPVDLSDLSCMQLPVTNTAITRTIYFKPLWAH